MMVAVEREQFGTPGSEGARRATGEPGVPTTAQPQSASSTEVPVHRTRRRLTAAYKQRVLHKVAELRGAHNGAVGAYLRSEGLYYSSVRKWEKSAAEGKLGASKASQKSQKDRQALQKENKALRRKLQRMENQLAKKELIIDLQKKLCDMMELDEQSNNDAGRP